MAVPHVKMKKFAEKIGKCSQRKWKNVAEFGNPVCYPEYISAYSVDNVLQECP